jgi:REP element-mobilizing transposase RayT
MDDLFKNKYRTQSSRLAVWDYGSNGQYFITICTAHRVPYFGQIADSRLICTTIGDHAIQCWQSIPEHHPFVALDAFVLMPDHLHGILAIYKPEPSIWVGNKFEPQQRNLATAVRGFKMAITSFARTHSIEFNWQHGYHDRIIRNHTHLKTVRKYIKNNPAKWVNPIDKISAGGL